MNTVRLVVTSKANRLTLVLVAILCAIHLSACIGLPGADSVDEGQKVWVELKRRMDVPEGISAGNRGLYFRPHAGFIEFVVIGVMLQPDEREHLRRVLTEIQAVQRGNPIKVFFYRGLES